MHWDVGRYTALTGRAPVPPEWTYGTWLSKCMYESRAEVEQSLDTADKLGVPIDVIGLDPLWLANRPGMDYDFATSSGTRRTSARSTSSWPCCASAVPGCACGSTRTSSREPPPTSPSGW